MTAISPSNAGFIVEIHLDDFHEGAIEFFVIGSESNDWAQEVIRTSNDDNEYDFTDYTQARPFIYEALGRVGAA